MKNKLILFLAQGLGIGRIPVAPGTFGSLLGLAWLALLLLPGNWWILGAGIALSTGLSVWLSGASEKILNQPDPGSVVIDEIIAIPFCFVGWLAWGHPGLLTVKTLFADHWPIVLAGF